jgi:hypothetical protein
MHHHLDDVGTRMIQRTALTPSCKFHSPPFDLSIQAPPESIPAIHPVLNHAAISVPVSVRH